MNLLLVEAHERLGDRVVLDDRRAEHLVRVLRVEVGRVVRAGVVDRGVGTATVVAVEVPPRGTGVSPTVELQLEAKLCGPLSEAVETRSKVDLLVGMPRPQVLHRVLQFSASMGVRQLDLVNAWRVEKSYFQSPSARPERLRRELLLGAEQGATPFVSEAALHTRFLGYLDALPPPDADERLRLVAHLNGAKPLERQVATAFEVDPDRSVLLAIGPEGGWIDREVETFVERGFRPVWLGPWVLRVEAAVVASLAQIDLLRRSIRTGQESRLPSAAE